MSESIPAMWSVRRTIPSDTAIAADLVNELVDAMSVREWSPREVFRVQLAFDEAIVNAIRHGNRFSADKTVQVEIQLDLEQVQIQITDQGKGFDPSQIPDPRDEDRLEVPGGRGVLLIHEVMTRVEYNPCGNQIRMTKIKGSDPPDVDDDDEDERDDL